MGEGDGQDHTRSRQRGKRRRRDEIANSALTQGALDAKMEMPRRLIGTSAARLGQPHIQMAGDLAPRGLANAVGGAACSVPKALGVTQTETVRLPEEEAWPLTGTWEGL